jgi:predicted RecB family nuclease
MKITSDVLESYLHCKFKSHLKLAAQQGTKCDFEAMLTELRAEVRLKATDTIIARHSADQVARNIPLTTASLKRGPQYILDGILENETLALHFDGLKRTEGESKLGNFHYLPMLFHEGRQITKGQKLLLDAYGLVLAGLQGRAPAYGVIWHGPECKATRVKLNPDHRQVEQVLCGLKDMATSTSPPRLLLNEHCPMCEFCQRCHEQAVREDNLSLLRGLAEKEVRRYARKGVLTLTQLAHTFRPRRKGKRAVRKTHHRYHALQALAIRDRRIYVLGTPELPDSPVKIYLDVEGIPDEGFVYLIGMVVVEGGAEKQFSFWADTKEQEHDIFEQFLAAVGQYDDFRVFCYGGYERTFLKRLRKSARRKKPIDRVLERLVNILSLVHAHFYFPTYSSGLKDIAGCLGCSWTEPGASGLQSLVWRARWEADHAGEWKEKLLSYNREDCTALRRVTELISTLGSRTGAPDGMRLTGESRPPVASVEELDRLGLIVRRGKIEFFHPDFEFINNCGHFDYQRQRVYVRTGKSRKKSQKKPPNRRNRRLRVSRRVQIISRKCPACGGTDVSQWPSGRKVTGYLGGTEE